MKSKYFMFVIGLCITFPTLAMWRQVSGQMGGINRCRVHFESTATIFCDKTNNKDDKIKNKVLLSYLEPYNSYHRLIFDEASCSTNECDGNCYKTPNHLLIKAGRKPYIGGNGGLLNPKLIEYEVVAKPVEGGAQVTVKGIVETEGIAPIAFNATQYGQSHNENPDIQVVYETTLLEDAILGALKERSVDRGLSDLTDTYFNGGQFLEKYIETLTTEWTSHLSDNDDGKRSAQYDDMIKRYFPRKAYWPSRWHDSQRSGRNESDLLSYWGEKEKFRVTLNTFKIGVEPIK